MRSDERIGFGLIAIAVVVALVAVWYLWVNP